MANHEIVLTTIRGNGIHTPQDNNRCNDRSGVAMRLVLPYPLGLELFT